ncbi:unnamed protein product [Brassica napus]|uniref:(rape) hypothetical protein n=3 Tax=Brassica TaxID=3705 RepID=A0A816J8Q8_BRANA|nr:unnamed protein product [Brassica napus]CAF1770234.1 unnamed protein product [Brassica napus]
MRRQPAKSSNKKSSTSLGVNEVGFCSLSASRIAVADDRERAQMFRG